jgi:hypothetical protein
MAVNDNGSDSGEHGETAQQPGRQEHRQTRHGDDSQHQHRGEGARTGLGLQTRRFPAGK